MILFIFIKKTLKLISGDRNHNINFLGRLGTKWNEHQGTLWSDGNILHLN